MTYPSTEQPLILRYFTWCPTSRELPGPPFLIIFMNYLSLEIDESQKLKMFADDSTILVAGRTLEYVNQQLDNYLKPNSSWIENNAMALNIAINRNPLSSALK